MVSSKPDGKSLIEIGKIGHRSKQAAEKALKAAAACR
jgi:hypothetical protein